MNETIDTDNTGDFPGMLVPTAIPVFAGFTEKAVVNGKEAFFRLIPIESMDAFTSVFGGAAKTLFTFSSLNASGEMDLSATTTKYNLYPSLLNYFGNTGRKCYVLSLGKYHYDQPFLSDSSPFFKALKVLESTEKPTLVCMPDIVCLENPDTGSDGRFSESLKVQSAVLDHCLRMNDRFALIDVPGGNHAVNTSGLERLMTVFRAGLSPENPNALSYGAAYYPWLQTDVIPPESITPDYFTPELITELAAVIRQTETVSGSGEEALNAFVPENRGTPAMEKAHCDLLQFRHYQQALSTIAGKIGQIPASGAVAGIYAFNDMNKGVWHAPANLGFNTVTGLPVYLTDEQQSSILNISPHDGKTVCAIRSFDGRGILVWGARTLAGNSGSWRYIQVRRLALCIEESARLITRSSMFSANDEQTWELVRSQIARLLTALWQDGALVGLRPADAFSVQCDATTNPPEQIENGILQVQIQFAPLRPASFIPLSIQQKMGVND